MPTSKVAVTLDEETVHRLDRLVRDHVFPSRSKAIQQAVEEKLARLERTGLIRECAKLDQVFERALADEGMSEEASQWPEY